MTDRSGQAAVESLFYLPLIILALLGFGYLLVNELHQHLLWAEVMSLHRARIYQAGSSSPSMIQCRTHSFWPAEIKQHLEIQCAKNYSQVRSKVPGFESRDIRVKGSY